MRPLGRETITIRRAPLAVSPRDNSEYRDWANATDTDVTNCNVQMFIMSEKLMAEITEDREAIREVFRVWAPAGTDVTYTDAIIWRGDEYEAHGRIGQWDHIMGPPHHVDFLIRRRVG